MKLLVAALLVTFAFASSAHAAPVTFELSGVANASGWGGGATDVLTVTYTFEDTLLPGSGSFGTGAGYASYGPVTSVQVAWGSESFSVIGGDIEIDDSGAYYLTLMPPSATFSGTLFGSTPTLFNVGISGAALTSTDLPLDTSFAVGATAQFNFGFGDSFSTSVFISPFTVEQVNAVPEPATLSLLGLGLAATAVRRFTRRS